MSDDGAHFRDELIAAARHAAETAYAPYSDFHVGAALLFEDGEIVSGGNVENASYGLSLCAETVAVSKAMADGRRGGLVAVAVTGPASDPITPCGRCRQVLNEIAALGDTDPLVLCVGQDRVREVQLSRLLPDAFGPESLIQAE
ncbi:cytidine deaminase [Altererythrobacter atlanticus]|uniref:Cytidine deaminase n=1 Tax=Croceibacterium atlanticum TaxID=1267766 RepID=A0A0F7KQG1_9SPHN|nr:cytidine deaminase [Croceibacterium atlanticum]AKH42758.1 Cytidine deaminase [Croceibacterium atlanticum]MBB5731539.1 cytidine deaminase [Croceibacterium atlanticum]